MRKRFDGLLLLSLATLPAGCRTEDEIAHGISGGLGSGSGSMTGGAATNGGRSTLDGDGTAGADGDAVNFDVPSPDDGTGTPGGPPSCKVGDDLDAVPPCNDQAPPGSFEPVLEWSWNGDAQYAMSTVIPLVANLTDDDENGEIDLCDTPDVVVVAWEQPWTDYGAARVFALDGETGIQHWRANDDVASYVTPALGDLDGDGVPEVVTLGFDGHFVAIDEDGSRLWRSAAPELGPYQTGAIALGDLDNDGDTEIVYSDVILDHEGTHVRTLSHPRVHEAWSLPVLADLDGDDDLEILLGAYAYHHDGTPYYVNPGLDDDVHLSVYPQVADFDGDGSPEVLIVAYEQVALLDHSGAMIDVFETAGLHTDANRPASIHDFDGDGLPEFTLTDPAAFGAYETDWTPVWTGTGGDASGQAGGTAFDFLGKGRAQGVYASEGDTWVFDDAGETLMRTERTSWTQLEYPVVVDVDNDQSAEFLVVSNIPFNEGGAPAPTVQVFRDAEDRWVGARRIWNQHTYHVTNVREDGTIPIVEPKHWLGLNTFRTQSQLENGGVCAPPPG